MNSAELIQQTIPNNDHPYVFVVLAFGKQFGLAMDNPIDEKAIKLFCKKTEEKLLFELK